MRPTRIISRLDIKGDDVIKSMNLEGLKKVGKPNELSKKYYKEGIDEILMIDTVATLYGRNNLHKIIKKATESIFVPITVGGGIRSLEDAEKMFKSGADKIAINSQAVKNPNFLKELKNIYGSQSLVVSIETKKINNQYEVFITNGRDRANINLLDWIKKCQDFGAGEILLTSIDKEGTGKGLDLELLKFVQNIVEIPIIFSGGVGNINHIIEALKFKNLDALAIAKTLHYNQLNINEIKKIINENKDN